MSKAELMWLNPTDILLVSELPRQAELEALYEECLKCCVEKADDPSAIECMLAAAMTSDLWLIWRETKGSGANLAKAMKTPSLSEQRRNVFKQADDRYRLEAQAFTSVRMRAEMLRELRALAKGMTPKQVDTRERKLIPFPGGKG